jgi:ABC-type Fe3+ transport system permease subunit
VTFPNLYLILYGALFLIDVVIAVLVGGAARRKDRSFGSFFWLSLLMGAVIPALVVAALPFRVDDLRHPQNK